MIVGNAQMFLPAYNSVITKTGEVYLYRRLYYGVSCTASVGAA